MDLIFYEFSIDMCGLFDNEYKFKCSHSKDTLGVSYKEKNSIKNDEISTRIIDFLGNKIYSNHRIIYYDKGYECLYFYIIPYVVNTNTSKINTELPDDIIYEMIQYLDKYDIMKLMHVINISDNIFKRLLYDRSKLDINIMKIINSNLSYMELYLGYYYYHYNIYLDFKNNFSILLCRYYCYKYNPVLFQLFDDVIKQPVDTLNLICGYNNDWNTILTTFSESYNISVNSKNFLDMICCLSEPIDVKNICDHLYTVDNFKITENHMKYYFEYMHHSKSKPNIRRIIKYLYNHNIVDTGTYLNYYIDDINLFMWYFGIVDEIDNYMTSSRVPKLDEHLYKSIFQEYIKRYNKTEGATSTLNAVSKLHNSILCIDFLMTYDSNCCLYRGEFNQIYMK
jgi:hypothetical protein